jgi:glucose-6-phosphate-specific signal transduction histidine kinase
MDAFLPGVAGWEDVYNNPGIWHFRVLVRDNGCGIDPDVLRSGRDGHWGLSGMRERARRIGAKLKVWSRSAGGTEVELFVPGHVAFRSNSARRRPRWLTRLRLRKARGDIGREKANKKGEQTAN